MKKVLVLSDVHGNFEQMEKIIKKNKNCDFKIYLGDFETKDIDKQKELFCQFDFYVEGNMDEHFEDEKYKVIEIEEVRILITHGHHFGGKNQLIDFDKLYEIAKKENASLIIHGHDHIDAIEEQEDIIRFNPGSITLPKGSNPPSYGVVKINKNDMKIYHIYL